jgi:hypothetical protein
VLTNKDRAHTGGISTVNLNLNLNLKEHGFLFRALVTMTKL